MSTTIPMSDRPGAHKESQEQQKKNQRRKIIIIALAILGFFSLVFLGGIAGALTNQPEINVKSDRLDLAKEGFVDLGVTMENIHPESIEFKFRDELLQVRNEDGRYLLYWEDLTEEQQNTKNLDINIEGIGDSKRFLFSKFAGDGKKFSEDLLVLVEGGTDTGDSTDDSTDEGGSLDPIPDPIDDDTDNDTDDSSIDDGTDNDSIDDVVTDPPPPLPACAYVIENPPSLKIPFNQLVEFKVATIGSSPCTPISMDVFQWSVDGKSGTGEVFRYRPEASAGKKTLLLKNSSTGLVEGEQEILVYYDQTFVSSQFENHFRLLNGRPSGDQTSRSKERIKRLVKSELVRIKFLNNSYESLSVDEYLRNLPMSQRAGYKDKIYRTESDETTTGKVISIIVQRTN